MEAKMKFLFLVSALLMSFNVFAGNEGPHAMPKPPVDAPKPFLFCEGPGRSVRVWFYETDVKRSYSVKVASGSDVLGYKESTLDLISVILPGDNVPDHVQVDGGTVTYLSNHAAPGGVFTLTYTYFGFPPSNFEAELTYNAKGYDDLGVSPEVVTTQVNCQY